MDLILAPGILERAIQESQKAYPNEACGLLVGLNNVDRFIPMKNVSGKAQQYAMDPAELITMLRELRTTGEKLIAIFHSHPHGPPEPSRTDVDRAYYPEAAHLIVSLAELNRPRVAAFRIVDGAVLHVEVHVIV